MIVLGRYSAVQPNRVIRQALSCSIDQHFDLQL